MPRRARPISEPDLFSIKSVPRRSARAAPPPGPMPAAGSLDIRPEDFGRVMGHAIGGVRGVYDRHSFNEEKRRALTAWENHLRRIIGRASTENIVELRPAVRESLIVRNGSRELEVAK